MVSAEQIGRSGFGQARNGVKFKGIERGDQGRGNGGESDGTKPDQTGSGQLAAPKDCKEFHKHAHFNETLGSSLA